MKKTGEVSLGWIVGASDPGLECDPVLVTVHGDQGAQQHVGQQAPDLVPGQGDLSLVTSLQHGTGAMGEHVLQLQGAGQDVSLYQPPVI